MKSKVYLYAGANSCLMKLGMASEAINAIQRITIIPNQIQIWRNNERLLLKIARSPRILRYKKEPRKICVKENKRHPFSQESEQERNLIERMYYTKLQLFLLKLSINYAAIVADSAIAYYEICLPHSCIFCSFALFFYPFLFISPDETLDGCSRVSSSALGSRSDFSQRNIPEHKPCPGMFCSTWRPHVSRWVFTALELPYTLM